MSEKERAMSDVREALAGPIRDAYYSARDHGGTMDSAGRDAADTILAAGWTPPTVEPSVEGVPRD